jgi:hypothetical protein
MERGALSPDRERAVVDAGTGDAQFAGVEVIDAHWPKALTPSTSWRTGKGGQQETSVGARKQTFTTPELKKPDTRPGLWVGRSQFPSLLPDRRGR